MLESDIRTLIELFQDSTGDVVDTIIISHITEYDEERNLVSIQTGIRVQTRNPPKITAPETD